MVGGLVGRLVKDAGEAEEAEEAKETKKTREVAGEGVEGRDPATAVGRRAGHGMRIEFGGGDERGNRVFGKLLERAEGQAGGLDNTNKHTR